MSKKSRELIQCPKYETLEVRPACFHLKARVAIRAFPLRLRREIGKAIFDLQKGREIGMPLCREMPRIALGVAELRIKDSDRSYRVFLYRKSARGILIFHAFVKKTQKTPVHEVELARKRLKEMLNGEV